MWPKGLDTCKSDKEVPQILSLVWNPHMFNRHELLRPWLTQFGNPEKKYSKLYSHPRGREFKSTSPEYPQTKVTGNQVTSVPAGDLQTHVKPLASQGRGYVGQILLTLLYTITLNINYDAQIQLEQLMKWPQLTSSNLEVRTCFFQVSKPFGHILDKCPNFLVTFWTSV